MLFTVPSPLRALKYNKYSYNFKIISCILNLRNIILGPSLVSVPGRSVCPNPPLVSTMFLLIPSDTQSVLFIQIYNQFKINIYSDRFGSCTNMNNNSLYNK